MKNPKPERRTTIFLTQYPRFPLFDGLLSGRKGLPTLQRGRFRLPTACSLQPNGSPVAMSGGPYGKIKHDNSLHTSKFSIVTSCPPDNKRCTHYFREFTAAGFLFLNIARISRHLSEYFRVFNISLFNFIRRKATKSHDRSPLFQKYKTKHVLSLSRELQNPYYRI